MSVHTDYAGPYLFVGGPADGQRRSVNASRDDWRVPAPIPVRSTYADPEFAHMDERPRPDLYWKRPLSIGAGTEITVMVWEHMPGAEAYRRALEHIAALANGGDRS